MTRRPDRGFTLIEMLIVIVVLGILATVTVFAVSGFSARAIGQACQTERRILEQASDVYLARAGLLEIPATGEGGNRFEQTLVDGGLLSEPSEYHDVTKDGQVIVRDEYTAKCS